MSTNSKNAIHEIKKLMKQFGFLNEEAVLKSFKTEDNTILETKDLKAGEKITKINDLFERVALETGSYRLVENFQVEVKEGEIVSVKEIFVDAKLKDGTQIKVEGDSVIEGAKVMVVTAEGEIPAPDGVHELEDGSKVETKDAVIVKLEPAMEEEKPEVEIEVSAEKMEEVVEDVPSVDIGDPVEVEMLDMLKDFIKKMSEKMAKMEEKMSKMDSDFNAFKKEPAARKIADGKTEFNKISNDGQNDLIAGIMRLREINK